MGPKKTWEKGDSTRLDPNPPYIKNLAEIWQRYINMWWDLWNSFPYNASKFKTRGNHPWKSYLPYLHQNCQLLISAVPSIPKCIQKFLLFANSSSSSIGMSSSLLISTRFLTCEWVCFWQTKQGIQYVWHNHILTHINLVTPYCFIIT